jgi:hypothetical protein
VSTSHCRIVLRAHPELPERLATIQEHLYEETHLEYAFAAIMRGLIALGLNQIEGAPNLAVLFMGARVKRGRKPGGKVPTAVVPLDLTQGEIDLEYEDEHNNALGPQPKKEVVARQRVRRRRPLRDAALLGPRRAEEDDTDPGMDLDDADTADGEPDGL